MTEFCVFTEPQQGATYDQLLAVCQGAESLGYTAFFRSDHFLRMGGVSGLPGPTDAWVTLGALARETTTIRLGTLVTSATFRHPGPLAISVAQVDQMSAGRVEFGLGAGWYEAEHQAYGLPFLSLKERFEVFAEQLAVITGLWAATPAAPFAFNGTHYQLSDSPGLPKPVQQPGPPIIVGGGGPRKTAGLAAQYASEWNRAFVSLDAWTTSAANVRAACESIGRDPASLSMSVGLIACVGTTEAEIAHRAGRIGREVDELRKNGAAGSPQEVVDKLAGYLAAGAQRVYFQIMDLDDLDHLDLIATQVAEAL